MGRSRYKQHEPWYPYLLTSSFIHGLPLFSKPEIAQYVIEAIKHHQSQNGLKVYAWCIMENHFALGCYRADKIGEILSLLLV